MQQFAMLYGQKKIKKIEHDLKLVAKQIAYALTSGNMENLSKTPGAGVSNGVWGGLVFSDFFRFIRLVNCICEFEKAEVHV